MTRGNHQHGAALDPVAAEARGFRGYSRNKSDRGIKAHGLAKYGAGVARAAELIEADRTGAVGAGHFLPTGALETPGRWLRMKNTQINALAVVVSGEEEHPELINQLLSRKARAVFRVFPAHNSAGDVLVGPLILRECEARIHQGPELRADIFASSEHGVVLGDGTEGLGEISLGSSIWAAERSKIAKAGEHFCAVSDAREVEKIVRQMTLTAVSSLMAKSRKKGIPASAWCASFSI